MMRVIVSASGKRMKWKKQRRRNASGSSFSLLLVMITIGRCVAWIISRVSWT